MTLAEATSRYLVHARQNDSTVNPRLQAFPPDQALMLLSSWFSADSPLTEITPARLRDFLSRWYVERACVSEGSLSDQRTEPVEVPEPHDLLNALAEFFTWVDQQLGKERAAQFSPLLIELGGALPRALEITKALTSAVRERGGAFGFPEFLTSFEEGGGSQYDIDVPGNVGAVDGYFRIVRVEGSLVEAVEMISEERVWPIVFPDVVAALLGVGYILNLELVRDRECWRIAGCGFAYPPGTAI